MKWHNFVCLKPESLGHMLASFISPTEVQNKLLAHSKDQRWAGTLTEKQVEQCLAMSSFEEVRDISTHEAVSVLRTLSVCYAVPTVMNNVKSTVLMFPSLRLPGGTCFVYYSTIFNITDII